MENVSKSIPDKWSLFSAELTFRIHWDWASSPLV